MIMMTQNFAASHDRIRESSLQEKIDQIRLHHIPEIYDHTLSQTRELITIVRMARAINHATGVAATSAAPVARCRSCYHPLLVPPNPAPCAQCDSSDDGRAVDDWFVMSGSTLSTGEEVYAHLPHISTERAAFAKEMLDLSSRLEMDTCSNLHRRWTRLWRSLLFCGLPSHHIPADMTFGQRVADLISTGVGSFQFLLGQTFVLIVWICCNLDVTDPSSWDPYDSTTSDLFACCLCSLDWFFHFCFHRYPFVLLNLCLSAQAAFTAPVHYL
jgi:uncharacterized membrane protein